LAKRDFFFRHQFDEVSKIDATEKNQKIYLAVARSQSSNWQNRKKFPAISRSSA